MKARWVKEFELYPGEQQEALGVFCEQNESDSGQRGKAYQVEIN